MLQQIINDRWKEAYKARNMIVKSAFESIKAKILNEEKSGRYQVPLSEEVIQNIIIKEVKELKETQSFFKETDEQFVETQMKIDVLSEYLPKQLSVEEVKEIINKSRVVETNKGKLIGLVVKEVGSRFDKSKISQLVNEILSEVK